MPALGAAAAAGVGAVLRVAGPWLVKGLGLAAAAGVGLYYFKDEAIAAIGSLFLFLGSFSLTQAGSIFNFLLEKTVIDFRGTLETLGMLSGIDIVWTAFRDIANIVIIGMFVFIAISLILGIKEYGERKMIAKVLVIAVLINFSLLFSKLIIDASNFVSVSFYNATGVQAVVIKTSEEVSSTAPGDQEVAFVPPPGVAGEFVRIMRITSIGDTFRALQTAAKDNIAVALGYSLVGTILFGALTFVFLYGAFLILARSILFVFLMIVAPLAFASWLIPTFAHNGWNKWWNALLRSAIFGPLLMIFLWASLTILKSAPGGSTTLGEFLANPADPSGWRIIIVYLFTIALLFISIRFANSFSTSIAGFSGVAGGLISPLTLGSRFGLAPLGRAIGRPFGTQYREARLEQAKEARTRRTLALEDVKTHGADTRLGKQAQAEADRQMKIAAKRMIQADRGGTIAKSKMNVMDTKPAQALVGGLGVTGFASGATPKGTKSYQERVEAKAKEAEKIASKLAPSDKDKEQAIEREEKRIREQRVIQKEQLTATLESAKATAEATKSTEKLVEKLGIAERVENAIKAEAAENKKKHDAKHEAAGTVGSEDHLKDLRQEDMRIQEASKRTKAVRDQINEVEGPVKRLTEQLEKFDSETAKIIANAQKNIPITQAKATADIVEEIGRRKGGLFYRKAVGKETRERYIKSGSSAAKLKAVVKSVEDDEKKPEKTAGAKPEKH